MSPEEVIYEDEDHFLFWREDLTNQSFRTGSVSIHFNRLGITDDFIFFLDAQGNRVATTEPDQLDPQLLEALEDIERLQGEAV